MKKITKIIVLAALCPFLNTQVNAVIVLSGINSTYNIQQYTDTSTHRVKPIKVGDKLPVEVWNLPLQVVNHPKDKKTITLSDYRGKLIILDFWATSCGSCVMAMPKFNLQQLQFSDSLLILPVSFEKRQNAQTSFQTNLILKRSRLGTVVEDVQLKYFFPHQYISHLVWIDKGGTVRAFTGTDYLTAENIRQLLRNEVVNWPVKQDLPNYDYTSPILTLNKSNLPVGSYPNKLYYSALTGHLNNITFMYNVVMDTICNKKHISMINHSILQLYLKARGLFSFPLSHVLLDVTDPERYVYDSTKGYKEQWSLKNTFCYQAVFSLQVPDTLQRNKILSDLDFYFNTNSRMKEQEIICLVISRVDPVDDYKATELKSQTSLTNTSIKVADLTDYLNQTLLSKPVIDESGLGELLITAEKDELSDVDALSKKLRQYGLQIIEKQRRMELFILGGPKRLH